MSTPDDHTVLGPPTDISVGPEDLEGDDATRDADEKPDVNEDAADTGKGGGTEGAGGAG